MSTAWSLSGEKLTSPGHGEPNANYPKAKLEFEALQVTENWRGFFFLQPPYS